MVSIDITSTSYFLVCNRILDMGNICKINNEIL